MTFEPGTPVILVPNHWFFTNFFLSPLLRFLAHNGSYKKILTCFIIDCNRHNNVYILQLHIHLLSGIWLQTNRWIATALPSAVWLLCIGAVGLKNWTVGSKDLARPCHFALKRGSYFSWWNGRNQISKTNPNGSSVERPSGQKCRVSILMLRSRVLYL